MKLERYLANLGYGSRREVAMMLAAGRVKRRDGSILRAADPFAHEDVLIDGRPIDAPPGEVLLLHKPVGYVCSTSESTRLIYELLPPRFLRRSPVIAPVGRLDRDTSGLLLLTDDGQLNHRITSPRSHLPKTYEAELARDLRGDEAALFASGTLMLDGEAEPLLPAELEVLGPRTARVTQRPKPLRRPRRSSSRRCPTPTERRLPLHPFARSRSMCRA
ncbi:MAG: 16S rRNA pseudouridine(516) synthase [Gemmatimonadetes bacterium]|nr:16S rRNA pseudouridine(516) synthase [Gemmatimonadota bacterium]